MIDLGYEGVLNPAGTGVRDARLNAAGAASPRTAA